MRCADPFYLLLLILIGAGYWYVRRARARRTASLPYPSVRAVAAPLGLPWYRDPRLLLILRAAAFILLVAALARPQKGQRTEELLTKGIDIILCIDTSTSMRAIDFKPMNRLDAAKDAAAAFIRGRRFDRIGIVVFSGMSFTQAPLTLDYGAVLDFLGTVAIGMTYTDGTAIGNAIITALNRLKGSDAKSKIIILLTDGRNNAGEVDPLTAARAAAALGVKIYSIGAGKPGGGVYPVDDPFFGTRYVQLQEDLDEDTLRAIADATDGLYFRAQSPQAMKEIYERINRLEKTEIKVKEYVDYTDLYLYILLAGAALCAREFILGNTLLAVIP